MKTKHTTQVKNFNGTHTELAENIGDLFYDSLSGLLKELSAKISSDGQKDHNRGRTKLAKELFTCAEHLNSASKHISKAWDICTPYVDKE
jgi:hypothetical protein